METIRLRTIRQTANEINAIDLDSALTENALRKMVADNTLTYTLNGNRVLIDIDHLFSVLASFVNIENGMLPHFRTIRQAAAELKTLDSKTSISEKLIRKLISEGSIPLLSVGTRALVAMESFAKELTETAPIEITPKKPIRPRTETISASEQFDALCRRFPQTFICKRKVS